MGTDQTMTWFWKILVSRMAEKSWVLNKIETALKDNNKHNSKDVFPRILLAGNE